MTSRIGTFLLCAAAVLGLDQLTKALASARLVPGEPVPVLGNFLRLTLVHNTGAAFGLFPGSRLPFILVSVLAIAVVLYLFARDAYRSLANRVLLGVFWAARSEISWTAFDGEGSWISSTWASERSDGPCSTSQILPSPWG